MMKTYNNVMSCGYQNHKKKLIEFILKLTLPRSCANVRGTVLQSDKSSLSASSDSLFEASAFVERAFLNFSSFAKT